ncbi:MULTISPECIES: YciI family protein [unclassified Amycolatopsis]|uniref:YciI family protein n=1 Tax=unclassified Amycolatopsis TaxID=2618356 RepID=UPI003453340D
MKYLVLIYGNPASRSAWAGMSDAQKAAGLRAYVEFNDGLDGSGERIVSERLAAPELTKQVIVRDDQVSTTDGPFAEIKEQLAGFYLLDCDSEDRALEIAARIPEAPYATIEVRPVMGLTGDVDFDLGDL